MKFTIGDKIILKRTGEEGVVVAIIGKDMAEVAVNGVSFPVYLDEVDHPYLKWFTEKQQKAPARPKEGEELPVEKIKHRPVRMPKGIYLSFMPEYRTDDLKDVVEKLKIFLVNELDEAVHFSYDVKFFHHSDFKLQSTVPAFTHLYLHTIAYADMNDRPRFHWQLSSTINPARAEQGVLTIKPSRLFAQVNELLLQNQPMFSYQLVSELLEKKQGVPATPPPPAAPVRQQANHKIRALADIPRYEVDLHIEQLIPSHKGLSNAEIMHIQLNELHRQVHTAIRNRQERMVIIHGLGTGALKEAVHKALKQYAEVKRFSNEWIGKYGFGATEVYFMYD